VLRIIADDGLDAVRHRRVADLADVSLGSTTYHFASRDDLIDAAFGLYLDEATTFLNGLARLGTGPGHTDTAATARTSASTDPLDALVSFVGRLLGGEFADPGLVRAEYDLILHATRRPALAERLVAWEDGRRTMLERAFRDAGAPRPADAARTLFALVRGIEVERLVHPRRTVQVRRRLQPVIAALLGRDSRYDRSGTQ
jgi:DNA-binding transcriptional regulator YbjK